MKNETKKPIPKKKIIQNRPDWILIALVLVLLGFGIVMVYSASYYHGETRFNDPYFFVKNQARNALLGLVVMFFVIYFFNYRILSNLKIAGVIYGFSVLLACSLFVIGSNINGATRWIEIGGITIQPSEFVKIGVIIMLSAYIVKYRKKLNQFKYVLIGGIIVLIPAAIVADENLSSALVIAFVGIFILFLSTPKIWYYVALFLGGGGISYYVYRVAVTTSSTDNELPGILGNFFKPYRLDRLRIWKDPFLDPIGDGYQPIQSLYAVGSGGIFGSGLTEGIQKLGFLPEPHNDIIFAVICEELGLIGAAILLILYGALVLRGLRVAMHAYDLFGALVASGIAGMIGVQALINVAVNTNTIPTTGMQLPLVSYGGTALIILLGSIGILINISRISEIKKP